MSKGSDFQQLLKVTIQGVVSWDGGEGWGSLAERNVQEGLMKRGMDFLSTDPSFC